MGEEGAWFGSSIDTGLGSGCLATALEINKSVTLSTALPLCTPCGTTNHHRTHLRTRTPTIILFSCKISPFVVS
jgi:hypothetical protein